VEKIVTLRAGATLFKATVPAVSQVRVEDAVRFSVNQQKLHGFDPASGVNRVQRAA
jgi:multiple sugar transport system ATP-binding protein